MAALKIVITGAGGQLGKELQLIAAAYADFDFIFLSKEDLPVDASKQVMQFFRKNQPDYCVNCAAYTAVDKAEAEKKLAFLVNAESVGTLASACRLSGTRLIHMSTDYVFDGNDPAPLNESAPTSPINVYGASKKKGEELAMQNNQDTIIIRTSWLYSGFGNNFLRTMIRLMGEKESINVVNDQVGSPTYAGDLANVIMQIISSGKFVAGIYHYSNEGEISWYDFALEIKTLIGSNCRINPVPTSAYPTPAKRPRFALMDKTKIRTVYSVDIPDWRWSLHACIDQQKNKAM